MFYQYPRKNKNQKQANRDFLGYQSPKIQLTNKKYAIYVF